jgi:hypothetical protein
MNQPRRRLSELTPQELSRRAAEYRRMALAAHGQPTSKSLDILAARYALLAAKREIVANTKSQHLSGQSEVRKLRALAEQAAANKPDPIRALADAIRMLAESEADPYLVMGVLIEGAVHTLRTTTPHERHQDCGLALVTILIDRLQANGISISQFLQR